jgi:hypothetical protein
MGQAIGDGLTGVFGGLRPRHGLKQERREGQVVETLLNGLEEGLDVAVIHQSGDPAARLR